MFKTGNITFPQASEKENTGFYISRGKYAFEAFPEPACNVNRQALRAHVPPEQPLLFCRAAAVGFSCPGTGQTCLSPQHIPVHVSFLKHACLKHQSLTSLPLLVASRKS